MSEIWGIYIYRLTHGDVGQLVSGAVRVDAVQVGSITVLSTQNQSSPDVALIPAHTHTHTLHMWYCNIFRAAIGGSLQLIQWCRWAVYLNSICLSMRLAGATRGSLPVERACSSRLEEMIWVVISVSAAVPAPQQLHRNNMRQQSTSKNGLDSWKKRHTPSPFFFVECLTHLLNVGGDVVDLGAVLVCYHHAFSGSGVSSQDHTILHKTSVTFSTCGSISCFQDTFSFCSFHSNCICSCAFWWVQFRVNHSTTNEE